MKKYENILLAVELDPKCDTTLARQAQEIVRTFNAKLTIVHAIEQMSSYGAAYGVAVGTDIEQLLLENATAEMKKVGKKLAVPPSNQIVKVGPAKIIILEEADKINADIIVVGSHGRHGLRLLLG